MRIATRVSAEKLKYLGVLNKQLLLKLRDADLLDDRCDINSVIGGKYDSKTIEIARVEYKELKGKLLFDKSFGKILASKGNPGKLLMFILYKLRLIQSREEAIDSFNLLCNRDNTISVELKDASVREGINLITQGEGREFSKHKFHPCVL